MKRWLANLAGLCGSSLPLATKRDLREMEKRLRMTDEEVAVALDALTAQEGKIAQEQSKRFDTLTAKIAELQAAVDAAASPSPRVVAALNGLQAAVQSLDDVIPDAPTT